MSSFKVQYSQEKWLWKILQMLKPIADIELTYSELIGKLKED